MSTSSKEDGKRSRFGNVVNEKDVEGHRFESPGGRYGAEWKRVGETLGAERLGYGVVSLDPGKRSCPYHFHHSEEEMFFVLEGRGRLRQGDSEGEEEIELGKGDFVSFAPGTGIAHQFINDGDVPFVYLGLSERVDGDVAEYPDSNKIIFRKTRLMLRREPRLDYFDGEG